MRDVAVLLMGPMRAGKTTVASYLSETRSFKRYSLADKLKQLHHVATGSLEKDRDWLQSIGAAARVVFGEDFWAKRLVEQLEKDQPNRFAVDDVRYENEFRLLFEYTKDRYERVCPILIHCPMDLQIVRGAEIHLLNHESEKYAHNLLNTAEYNSGVSYWWTEGLSKLKIPVLDGTLPMNEYYDAIESILRFDDYDRIRYAFKDLNFITNDDAEMELYDVDEG